MLHYLGRQGRGNLVIVDRFAPVDKKANWENGPFALAVERGELFDWLAKEKPTVSHFIHLGARTDTTEFDMAVHQLLNVEYSQRAWAYCAENGVPLIYASSAATYGDGALGYADSHDIVHQLQPLNPYGISKNEFDKWALAQTSAPPFWAGLKFFNVYGPSEGHKGRMASVIFHAFNQIRDTGHVKLFRSHKAGFEDGQQQRDFIYVKDIVAVIEWLMGQNDGSRVGNGLYNLGTGKARSFYDLASAVFTGLGKTPDIRFIDMPLDIRDKYQYYTQAEMAKLRSAGWDRPFWGLDEGVVDYVSNYLAKGLYY